MLTKEKIIENFGTKTNACQQIGCSRPALDAFIKQGFIPEFSKNGPSRGKNWHKILFNLGFNENLEPL